MKNCVDKIFPGAELLREDSVEAQYMIPAGDDRFWLAVPADKDLNALHFIFVFSGLGGTGKANNISGDGIPGEFRRQMLQAGFAFICAECSPRAWGDPESTRATLSAMEYCRRQGVVLPGRTDLLGLSMGGLGALMFAARHPEKIRKVTDVFGITDLEEFSKYSKYRADLELLPETERADRRPCAKAACYKDMELLIIHGTEDTTVDISYSERLYALLQKQGTPCDFIRVPGMGHSNDILKETGAAIREFFSEGS